MKTVVKMSKQEPHYKRINFITVTFRAQNFIHHSIHSEKTVIFVCYVSKNLSSATFVPQTLYFFTKAKAVPACCHC